MEQPKSVVHEPERIRALAHPLRLQLLDLLGQHGELTATECAEHTDESVASCSFHLRMLEKYGFIERAEQRGREKPWRRTSEGLVTEADPEFPETVLASTELAVQTVTHRAEAFRRVAARMDDESKDWLDATQVSNVGFWATVEEVSALGAEITEIITRFQDRRAPERRPEGARFIHALSLIYAEPNARP